MITDAIKPLLLLVGELLSRSYSFECAMNSLRGSVKRLLIARRMLDHRNNIDERLVVAHLMRLLQIINREPLIGRTQVLAQLTKCFCSPSPWSIKQDLNRLHVSGILFHETRKRRQIVFRFIFLAV